MTRSALVLVLVGSFVGAGLGAEEPVAEPDLAKGKDQVLQGDYNGGIATLTGVVRRLNAAAGRDAEAADAYLHLGLAYAGLNQSSAARSQFVQALKRDPAIAPDPKTASRTALETFAAARREAEEDGVLAAAQKARKKKSPGTRIALGVGGLAAGAGAVVLAAGSGDSPAVPPLASFVPVSTSPLIQLLTVQPPPGSTFSAGTGVSVTIQSGNLAAGSEEFRFFYVVEAVTADGRVCLRGRAGPFGLSPGSTISGGFGLAPTCTPPYTTESLEISLEDLTGARPHHASYRGRYQVIP